MADKNKQIIKMVGVALFIAIVVVFQILGSFIRFGPFSVSLVLVPIVVGAAIYGPGTGALLGGAFGVVVIINCINGVDAGGNILWTANPFATAALCLLKGILAGYSSGYVYKKIAVKKKYTAVFVSAVVCPTMNTGIFLTALFFIFRGILADWASAAGADVLYYLFVIIAGMNYLPELCVNIILCPAILRVINAVK